MSDTIELVLLNGGIAVVGAAVVLLAGVPWRRGWLPTVFGLALAVGLGACGLVTILGAMAGIDVSPAATGALVVAALFVAWVVLRGKTPGLGELELPRSGTVGRVLELVALALLAVLSVRILRLGAATGLDVWDGWAMWAPKAHALYVEGDVWGPVFTDPAYGMQHEEYPVLLPALEALASGAIGRFDPPLADIEASVALVAFGWGAWAILRVVVMPAVAAATALVLTGSTPVIENAAAGYADTVVATFTALGLLCLGVWLVRGSGATLVLAGLFLSAAASTKSEGLLFALAAVTAAAVVARGLRRSLRSVALLGVGVFAVPVAWMVVDRLNGPGAQNVDVGMVVHPGYWLAEGDRIPTAAWRLVDEIAEGWPLAALLALTAIGAALAARRWWEALFVGLWSGLAFSALVAVYFTSTAPIGWHLATSADRVVFSIVLGAATVSPVLAARVWEVSRRRADEVVAGVAGERPGASGGVPARLPGGAR